MRSSNESHRHLACAFPAESATHDSNPFVCPQVISRSPAESATGMLSIADFRQNRQLAYTYISSPTYRYRASAHLQPCAGLSRPRSWISGRIGNWILHPATTAPIPAESATVISSPPWGRLCPQPVSGGRVPTAAQLALKRRWETPTEGDRRRANEGAGVGFPAESATAAGRPGHA